MSINGPPYGTQNDPPVTDVTKIAGVISLLKGVISVLQAGLTVTISGTPAVTLSGTNNSVKVQDGTNPLLMDASGRPSVVRSSDAISVGVSEVTPLFAPIACSSSGVNVIVAAVTNKKIRVLNYIITASAAVNAKWQSHTAGDKSGLLYLAANGGAVGPDSVSGWLETAAGESLDLNLSGAVPVGGHLSYITV